jgi:hypothetical protein
MGEAPWLRLDPEARGGQTRGIGWSPDDLGNND